MLYDLLYYGYNPACSASGFPSIVQRALHSETPDSDGPGNIERGMFAFHEAMEAELQRVPEDSTHIVPLSSGLDSRAIYAYLLEDSQLRKTNIKTVSFGTPTTWDFEVGQTLAKHAGVDNVTLNLESDQFDWSEQSIRRYVRTIESPTRIFEGYVNSTVINQFTDPFVVWSGFLGETSCGSHQPNDPFETWDGAREVFVNKNRFTPKLVAPEYDPTACLPDEPYVSRGLLSYEEQLDFSHRQQCFIRPLVVCDADRYLTPFATEHWLEFALNLPRSLRRDRTFFVEMMSEQYPELFSHPTDMKHGLPPTAGRYRELIRQVRLQLEYSINTVARRNFVHPGTNYVDFERKLREGGELSDTVKSFVTDFDDRVEQDILRLWNEHQSGADRSKELRAIASAEVYLDERM